MNDMNIRKRAITLAICCCFCLAVAPSASADFVAVTTVIKDDPETDFQCTQGNGVHVPGPLTVCNVSAAFDGASNVLPSVASAELQVYNGAIPDVFYQHPFNFQPFAPPCAAIPAFPDLICDTFITIGHKCGPSPPGIDNTGVHGDFDPGEFEFNGHIVGGWFNSDPVGGVQGVAGEYPDLQVLILQSSVAQGLSLSGDIDLFWRPDYNGETYAELDVPLECVAAYGSCPTDSDGDGFSNAFDLATLLGNWVS